MNKFFELYKQQNNQLVVTLVDDRYFKNQPIAGGQIIGQVAILINDGSWYKGKKVMADAVRVDADTFAALCSQYGTPAVPWFPGSRKETAKKSDTDKKTYALRQALESSQYKEDLEEICTFEGYTWRAADAVRLLKAMNSEFNKPTKKQLTIFAAVDAEPAPAADTEPVTAVDAEPAPAADAEPVTAVEDIAAAVDAHFADLVANAPADDEQPAAPSIKKTATPSRQKKQLAAWRGAVVEVLEIRAADNSAIIKFKGGAITSAPADELESTTAKKTALPDWVKPGAVVNLHSALDPDREPGRYTIESVKNTTIYYVEGYKSMINYFMHYAEPAPAADAEPQAAVWSDNMDDAIANRAADTCPLPNWAVDGVHCTYTSAEYGPLTGTACRFHWVQLCHCWLCDFSNEKTTIIGAVVDNIEPLAAARIKSNYEAMIQQAAADAAPAPRRRLNIAPRLLRRLRPVRWVAVAFVVCLLSGLLLGTNTSNAAADADTDDIAAVYELAPVTITAAAVTDAPAADAVTPSNEKTDLTPSSEKTASDIAAVTDAPAADAVTPSNEKTASDIAAVTDAPAAADADGLTICAGTAWAYTMMNWA